MQALQTDYGDTALKRLVQLLQKCERTERRALQHETFKFCEQWNSFKGERSNECQLVDDHQ
jgi:hypothetical protein